jgi:methyl-accepting chemotaxis protein
MKLGNKILLGFGVVCAIFIAISLVSVFAVIGIQRDTRSLRDEIMPSNDYIGNMMFNVASEAFNIVEYSYNTDEDSWNESTKFHNAVNESLNSFKGLLSKGFASDNQSVRDLTATFERQYAQYHEIINQLPSVNQAIVDNRANAVKQYTSFTETSTKYVSDQDVAIKEVINSLEGVDTANLNKRFERVTKAIEMQNAGSDMYINMLRGMYYQDVTFFDRAIDSAKMVATDLQALLGNTELASNRETLTRLNEQTQNVATAIAALRDAFSQTIDAKDKRLQARNESISTATSLNAAMTGQANSFAASTLASVTKTLLTQIIGNLLALLLSMALSFIIIRSITKPVNHVIEVLTEGAQEVDSASGELSTASNTIAEGATENAASLEETSAALEELSSMTKRNSDNAVEANALMSQATEAVTKAESSMTNVIEAMEQITASGNEIGKIIKTIDEIAFQTNLLALNAAVEAARAGEAGAGFAVVADEVRNLAIRSADAAKNTADLIAATISNINSGSGMVNSTSESFQTVSVHAAKVAQLVSEVAEASKEQSQGINQITTAMTQMDKVTQTNAASAEEAASAASQLSLQAGNLMSAVEEITSIVHGRNSRGPAPQARRKSSGRESSVTSRPARAIPAPAVSKSKTEALPMDADDDFDF